MVVAVSDRALRAADPQQLDEEDVPRLVEVLSRDRVKRFASTAITQTWAPPYGYKPHARQQVLHAVRKRWRKRFRIANWGRRTGKTFGGAADVADHQAELLFDKLTGQGRWEGRPHRPWKAGKGANPEPFLRIIVVAPTYSLLEEPKINLQRALGRIEDGGWIVHQNDKRWWLLGGARAEFYSGDRPERIVGGKADEMWLEEAARLKESVWRDNIAPWLADTQGSVLATSTPLGKNWFYRDFWARGNVKAAKDVAESDGVDWRKLLDAAYACVYASTLHNTTVPGLREEVLAMRDRIPLEMWRRNFEASFEAFLGQCFVLLPEHRLRQRPTPEEMSRIWAGLDWGQTHRACFGVGGQTRAGRYVVVDAAARSNTDSDGDHAWARRHQGDRTVWTTIAWQLLVDFVGEDRWREVPCYLPHDAVETKRRFKHRGFKVREAWQDPASSLDWFKVVLRNGELGIGPAVLWSSMQTLHHPEEGRWSNKPWVEEDDDPFDMARYLFSVPIQRGETKADPRHLLGWGLR